MSDEKTEIEQLREQVEMLQAELQKQQNLAALAQLREQGNDQPSGLWASMSRDAKVLTALLAVIWSFALSFIVASLVIEDMDFFPDAFLLGFVFPALLSFGVFVLNPIGQRFEDKLHQADLKRERERLEAEREQLEWDAAHLEVFEAQRLKAEAGSAEAVATYNKAQAAAAIRDSGPRKTHEVICGDCGHVGRAYRPGTPGDKANENCRNQVLKSSTWFGDPDSYGICGQTTYYRE